MAFFCLIAISCSPSPKMSVIFEKGTERIQNATTADEVYQIDLEIMNEVKEFITENENFNSSEDEDLRLAIDRYCEVFSNKTGVAVEKKSLSIGFVMTAGMRDKK